MMDGDPSQDVQQAPVEPFVQTAPPNKQKRIAIIVICVLIVLIGLVTGVMLWKP